MDRDRLVEFLSQHQLAGGEMSDEEVARSALRMHDLMHTQAEELEARGFRHLTVVHGPIETEEQGALKHLYDWERAHPGAVAKWGGPMDRTTFVFAPANADAHLEQLAAVAHKHNPGLWEIRAGWQ